MAQDFPVPKLFVEKFRVLLYNSHIYLPREIIQRRSTSEFFERSYPVVCGKKRLVFRVDRSAYWIVTGSDSVCGQHWAAAWYLDFRA